MIDVVARVERVDVRDADDASQRESRDPHWNACEALLRGVATPRDDVSINAHPHEFRSMRFPKRDTSRTVTRYPSREKRSRRRIGRVGKSCEPRHVVLFWYRESRGHRGRVVDAGVSRAPGIDPNPAVSAHRTHSPPGNAPYSKTREAGRFRAVSAVPAGCHLVVLLDDVRAGTPLDGGLGVAATGGFW